MRRQLSKGETFKVDYITYVLIVAALLCLCAYSLWTLRREENLERSPRRVPGKQAGADRDSSTDGLAQAEIVQQRELHNVPAPWGWPGNAGSNGTPATHEKSNGHGSLYHWVDQLVSEKQTTDDLAYQQKREASIRALLEDRFYSSSHSTAIKYHKTKPPLLRDPSEPHDQMDNFPSGRLDRIQAGLRHQNGTRQIGQKGPKFPEDVQLSDVRTPWGW